jgi:hypothetical protein
MANKAWEIKVIFLTLSINGPTRIIGSLEVNHSYYVLSSKFFDIFIKKQGGPRCRKKIADLFLLQI